jgi:hypothetical protein
MPTDTERLNWLEKGDNDYACPICDPVTHEWHIFHNDDSKDATGDTLRAAIDEAMQKQGEQ